VTLAERSQTVWDDVDEGTEQREAARLRRLRSMASGREEPRRVVPSGRLRRLLEELVDERLGVVESVDVPHVLVEELDYALRPPAFERRVPTYGAFVMPRAAPPAWEEPTNLRVSVLPTQERADDDARRYADGRASWVVRSVDGINKLVVFDRAAGSERDLVVLAGASKAVVVQRDARGIVRMVGDFGVVRWDGVTWHHEPPISTWLGDASDGLDAEHTALLDQLLHFAVHDLGARGVGALFVYRPTSVRWPGFEIRQPTPPPLSIERPSDLAPLFHVITQVDGAAVFDSTGTLRKLGVRLVPSVEAEAAVAPFRGTRHTAARRFSYDDQSAVVIAISEDGPVTVMRRGQLIASSPADPVLVPESANE
jgi:Probable sensor domain DACNK/DisA bacterial checkpoint controller nucleotide-binding